MERWLHGLRCEPFDALDVLFWPKAVELVAALRALWAAVGIPWERGGDVRLLELGSFHAPADTSEYFGVYIRLALAADARYADRPDRPDRRARALRIVDGFIRHVPNRRRVLFHASGIGDCPATMLAERLEAGDRVSVLVETDVPEPFIPEPEGGMGT
jgi:hypothetical protein